MVEGTKLAQRPWIVSVYGHLFEDGEAFVDHGRVSNPMLAKPEVRQARSLAIDRNAIASEVELGTAAADVHPASKGDVVYNPDSSGISDS